MNKPCDIYGTEYIPQRRSASAIEKKSPPIRTRYVTELKLNLRKGRAQRVSRNWPPGLMEQDSQSDDHGEHTDPEDVQVKAILCRASSSTDNQDQITTGCVSQIGRDVIQFVTPTAKSKGNKREKVDSKLGLLNSGNSAEFVEDYQKTVNECAVERETGRESKRSVNTPGQMGPLTFSTESKRTSDTQTSVQDEQRLGASSTQTAAQTNVSPGSFSISSLRQGLQMSHSETQASPTTLKKEIDWPNYSVKNTEFNKFMQEMALNNIHSVLSEANRELCFDEPSVTSACTLIRSSVAEEPSMHTLAECVSTTTVISPMAGKTSRGTQSEQLEQVKAVRDMEIQTGLAEIPEELSQDISLNEASSLSNEVFVIPILTNSAGVQSGPMIVLLPNSLHKQFSVEEGTRFTFGVCVMVETDKKFTTNRINSPFPLNRDVPITSRLPLPTNGLIQGKWTQDVNRDSNDLTLGNRHTMEQDRFVSPSPSSYLILPPVQNFARNSDSPSLAASASDSGRYWHNPINLTGATAAGLTPIPDQITPPRKSLYRLVRENISSVSNKTQRPIVHASKLPHLATSIPGLEFRSEVNQPNRDFVKDLCQDETGNRECYGVVYQDESQTNQLRPERESYKSMENMQPSSTQKTGFLSPSQHNKDVVFVERSSSQNSSLDSTRTDYDQNYMRIKLNSRHQTSGDSMEPQAGRNGGKTFSERPMRSNSEGSLGQFDARPDYSTYQKQMRRSSGWRPSEPRRSVSPSAPVPPCVTTTQLSRNAQDQEIDRNAWNTSLQRRLFSPARTDLRETASRAHETSTGSRLGGRATHNVAPSRNYRLVSHGRTIPTVRDTSDRKRMASQISSGKPNSLFPHDPRMEGRNDKSKQTTDRSRMGIKMISSDHSAVRSRFGSLTVPRTISGTEQNEFEVERVFELNQYDDLVKSHLNAADRRIKAVALKNGCRIRITGPFTKPDTSLCGAANRGKTLYNCHIAGPSEDRIGKCVNFLKETFPNSFLRTNWRV
ncbi:hypothetical protein D915_005915 [Fasciola hepatica]|uniref:Uncharacterized protein n=1 Tax=Fasciola hepatica TaxID=6192 RepID=A0A4E0RAI5_FASHE|nr:hypothetical protein D915_005915 [Fasciola hepatica]